VSARARLPGCLLHSCTAAQLHSCTTARLPSAPLLPRLLPPPVAARNAPATNPTTALPSTPPPPPHTRSSVRDSGMMLLSALLPDCRWLGGSANIAVRARGPLGAPALEGSASLGRGSLATPFTKQPLTGISGLLKVRRRRAGVGRYSVRSRQGAGRPLRRCTLLLLLPSCNPNHPPAPNRPPTHSPPPPRRWRAGA
jgi:hypothetical protein